MEGEYETAPKLLNGTSFNDLLTSNLDFKVTPFLTLNISEMSKDTAIVAMECE